MLSLTLAHVSLRRMDSFSRLQVLRVARRVLQTPVAAGGPKHAVDSHIVTYFYAKYFRVASVKANRLHFGCL
jgi:hypothetical protein